MVTVTGLGHRSLFNHALGSRPFRDTGLFERIGGQPAVGRLADLLYEGIGGDDQLRPLFPRDLAGSRSMQKLFFAEWLGGPRRYSAQAYKGLGPSHDGLPITPALAGRWLEHFRRSMEATVAAENDRTTIFAEVRALAMALVSRLHYAARAGFLKTIEVLLEHGADPGARDSHGRTPLDWLAQAAPSVPRAAVRDLLAPGQRR
jgi:truncated hemoglobin YjbI